MKTKLLFYFLIVGGIANAQCNLTAVASIVSNVLCNGLRDGAAASTVSGGTTPYTYSWSNGQTAFKASGLSAGSYTVTVTDKNGCTSTSSVNITQPSVLKMSAIVTTNVLCNRGSTGSATTSVSGGVSPYYYSWTSGATASSAHFLAAGRYTVTVEDVNGCTATAWVNITQPSAINIVKASLPDNGKCNGSASIKVSGGISPYTYLWNPGKQTSDSIYNQCYGSYCCTITDNNGCIDSACVTVSLSTGIEQLTINNGQWTIEPNPNNGKFNIVVSGQWSVVSESSVEIYNVLGQKVFEQLTMDNGQWTINISGQPDGVYFYRIAGEKGELIGYGKLIIEH